MLKSIVTDSTISTTWWTPTRCICTAAHRTRSTTHYGKRQFARTLILAGKLCSVFCHIALPISPFSFVPVVATGFDDLQKRVEAQTQQAAAHQEKLKVTLCPSLAMLPCSTPLQELQQRISALTQRHQLSNASRLHRASALQTQLTHRVIKLVQHLHLLIPALRSSALRPEEEALRTALEEIDDEVRRPGGTGRIRGKLNELWALVGAVTAARQQDRRTGGVEWAVVDEDGLAQIAQVLGEEQAGLAHLTKLLQKDLKDLAVIQGSSPQEDDVDMGASTATLRASTF